MNANHYCMNACPHYSTHSQNCVCPDVAPVAASGKKPSLYYDIYPDIAALMTSCVRLSTEKFGASCSFCAYQKRVDVYVFPHGPTSPRDMQALGSVNIDPHNLKGTKQGLQDLQMRLLRATGATL